MNRTDYLAPSPIYFSTSAHNAASRTSRNSETCLNHESLWTSEFTHPRRKPAARRKKEWFFSNDVPERRYIVWLLLRNA